MEAFFVSIIFLGIILVIGSLFFIAMDKVNGKDFFKEFDRKKEEMFNLIQDSEEMVHELNRMSDYVVSVVAEKNQEFFNKNNSLNLHDTEIIIEKNPIQVEKVSEAQVKEVEVHDLPSDQHTNEIEIPMDKLPPVYKALEDKRQVNTQFSHNSQMYDKDVSNIEKSKLVLNSRRKEVLLMIEQGLSNDEISDKLKIGKGEIGLIRGLSR